MLNWLFYRLLIFFIIFSVLCVKSANAITVNSLFANGRWVKIETNSTGIHKIQYSWLKNLGFSQPGKVKIYGSRNDPMSRNNAYPSVNRPVQLPVLRINDAGNESLILYVRGCISWQFDEKSGEYCPIVNQAAQGKSWFFLTEDDTDDLRFTTNGNHTESPEMKISTYEDLIFWGEENSNLLESGDQWFTSVMSGGSVLTKAFQISDRLPDELAIFKVYASGRSLSSTKLELSVNGNLVSGIPFKPVQPTQDGDFASADSVKISRIIPGIDLNLSLKYIGSSADQCWFDYATIQTKRNLLYKGVPLLFRNSGIPKSDKIIEYQVNGAISGLQLWEVTNPLTPVQIAYQQNNGRLLFQTKSDSLRSFLLFDPLSQFPGMTKTEEVANSDILKVESPQCLIITPMQFLDQANRLAAFHRQKDGLTVAIVPVESVFNELSGGYPDISAIKNFIRYLYLQKFTGNGSTLKYLLLFGKGTCDPVHSAGVNNPDWIPSFQSKNSLNAINSYVTDDFFGFLDPDDGETSGSLDLGIGRIPAVTIAEATTAVDKIIHYHESQSLGDWRNNLTFIGDDEDNNIHVNDSETLAAIVNTKNPEYRTSKIFLDAFPQILKPDERYPEVNAAIHGAVHSGSLFVNYIGHASEDGLAHERVLTAKDIESWTNSDRLPLFVTATCEFSRWDMIQKRSAGERLLFHPTGGAIALLSATRLVYSASNFEINKSFIKHVFDRDGAGRTIRLGDLIRLIKNETGGSVNTLKFCLLGDPALRLNYPEYSCRNLTINNQPVDQFAGTASPLSLLTISGEIVDYSGKRMSQFGGKLFATVYDQPYSKTTLGNGNLPVFTYKVQDNALYKGDAIVKNGTFTYSFVVPKDINFNKEAGLIRYYFSNGTVDGNGSFADIHFNGTENSTENDIDGPSIRLFLENEDFKDGSTVSSSPLLQVFLSDESGINTSGISIGHDITLILDGLPQNQLVLNEYYKSDPGNWKTGTINYPFSNLSVGPHTLKLKVWDNANNSSSVTIRFEVVKGLIVSSVYNFPNPFSDQTRFVITHNRYGEAVDVHLEILDLAGKNLYSKNQTLVTRGYEINDLYWEPLNMNPVPLNGIYIYRISLTDSQGLHTYKSGRLIWKK